MSEKDSTFPFLHLGKRLKGRREMVHESIGEVSGAVEIETDMLAQIEAGKVRPSEDILSLLISYLDISDNEADRLWELAGYAQTKKGMGAEALLDEIAGKSLFMLVPFDHRTLYADSTNVAVNQHGVVLTFLQSTGLGSNQLMPVARVGLSKEHAQSVITLLQESLEQANKPRTPKSLPAPKNTKKDS